MGLGDKFKDLKKQAQEAVGEHRDQIQDAVGVVGVAATVRRRAADRRGSPSSARRRVRRSTRWQTRSRRGAGAQRNHRARRTRRAGRTRGRPVGTPQLTDALQRVIAPVPPDRRLRRAVQLLTGLVLYGVTASMLVLAGLGLDPWDVLHQGLSRTFGLAIGTWAIIVSVLALIGWRALRQRLGVGTITNAILIGVVMDIMLSLVHPPHAFGRADRAARRRRRAQRHRHGPVHRCRARARTP